MRKTIRILSLLSAPALVVGIIMMTQVGRSAEPTSVKKGTPADGHEIHVLAPHVIDGKAVGPFHHYCKVVSPEPFIECLLYNTPEPDAKLVAIEYLVDKKMVRETIPLMDWNKNWHDHAAEIASGRVQVLDLPEEKAKEVANVVANTDGIVFQIWPSDAKLPTGKVSIAQSVAHQHRKEEAKK